MTLRFQRHYPRVGELTVIAETTITVVVNEPFTEDEGKREMARAKVEIVRKLREAADELERSV